MLNITTSKYKDYPYEDEHTEAYNSAYKRYPEDKARELNRLKTMLNANNSQLADLQSCKNMLSSRNVFGAYDCTKMFGVSDSSRQSVLDSLQARFQIWSDNKQLVDFLARVQGVYNRVGTSQTNALLRDLSAIDTALTLPAFVSHVDTYRLAFDLQLHARTGTSCVEQRLIETASSLFELGRLELAIVDANNNIVEESSEESDADEAIGPQFPISGERIERCQLSRTYFEYLENSWRRHHADERRAAQTQIQHEASSAAVDELSARLKKQEATWQALISGLWSLVERIFGSANDMPPSVSQSLIDSGLWPRFTPIHIVKYMLNSNSSDKHRPLVNVESFVDLLGALCVCWCSKSQVIRCAKWSKKGDMFNANKELLNAPHTNWSPKAYPQWLVLQLEMDIVIRETQVRVAKCMIDGAKINSLNKVHFIIFDEMKFCLDEPPFFEFKIILLFKKTYYIFNSNQNCISIVGF